MSCGYLSWVEADTRRGGYRGALSLAVKHEYKKPGEGATEPWVFLYLQGLRLLGALWLWRVWYA